MATIPIISKQYSTRFSFFLLAARLILAMILLLKAVYFISNAGLLRQMIIESSFAAGVSFLTIYVMVAHLLGGVMIVAALFMRIALLAQLPLLLAAIFFIIPQQGFHALSSDFSASLLALALCILLLLKGSGKFSIETFLKNYEL